MQISSTIEESDLNAGKVVKVSRWTVGPDDNSLHVRFDDTRGHVHEQDSHKLPLRLIARIATGVIEGKMVAGLPPN